MLCNQVSLNADVEIASNDIALKADTFRYRFRFLDIFFLFTFII